MDTIVQWATILSPIIAVVIAILTSRSSAKATAKQVAALEESTKKQVESIKTLSKQMIEASIKQVELEIEKNLFYANLAKQEWEGIDKINNSGMAHMAEWKKIATKQFQEEKPEREYKLYIGYIESLEGMRKKLIENKKRLI